MKNVIAAVAISISTLLMAPVYAEDTNTSTEEVILYVDINNDSAEKMADLLLGVGVSKAEAIVKYRTEHGPFLSVEDLMLVPGIGQATLEKNRNAIKLSDTEY